MGKQWMCDIVSILNTDGIRAVEAFPKGSRIACSEPVAAVGLQRVNFRTGMGEFEIRMLWPSALGGWEGQTAAARVVELLEGAGIFCKMEPMEFLAGSDCFQIRILGKKTVTEPLYPRVWINGRRLSGIVDFTAEQVRDRRLIRKTGETEPVGITPGVGGWKIRVVQEYLPGEGDTTDWEESFQVDVEEKHLYTSYYRGEWNRISRHVCPDCVRVEVEGFALRREVVELG